MASIELGIFAKGLARGVLLSRSGVPAENTRAIHLREANFALMACFRRGSQGSQARTFKIRSAYK